MERKLGWIGMATLALLLAGGCGGMEGFDDDSVEARKQALTDHSYTVQVRWLGTGALEFFYDGRVFLVDPHFSRSVPWQAFINEILNYKFKSFHITTKPPFHYIDPYPTDSCSVFYRPTVKGNLIDEYYQTIGGGSRIHSVIVSHTHFDHAMDVPSMAADLPDTQFWGSSDLRDLFQRINGTSSNWHGATTLQTHTIYDRNGHKVELTTYPWGHMDNPFTGAIQPSLGCGNQDPLKVWEYKQNAMYAIKLKFSTQTGGTQTFLIAGPDFDNHSLSEIGSASVLFFPMSEYNVDVQDALGQLLDSTGATKVVPIHHDDYFAPITHPQCSSTCPDPNATWCWGGSQVGLLTRDPTPEATNYINNMVGDYGNVTVALACAAVKFFYPAFTGTCTKYNLIQNVVAWFASSIFTPLTKGDMNAFKVYLNGRNVSPMVTKMFRPLYPAYKTCQDLLGGTCVSAMTPISPLYEFVGQLSCSYGYVCRVPKAATIAGCEDNGGTCAATCDLDSYFVANDFCLTGSCCKPRPCNEVGGYCAGGSSCGEFAEQIVGQCSYSYQTCCKQKVCGDEPNTYCSIKGCGLTAIQVPLTGCPTGICCKTQTILF